MSHFPTQRSKQMNPPPLKSPPLQPHPTKPEGTFWDRKSFILAPLITAIVCFALSQYSIEVLQDYGWSLFIGLPIVTGFFSAILYNIGRPKRLAETIGVGGLSGAILCSSYLLLGLEGLLCILMAMPLVMPLGIIGSILGLIVCRLFRKPVQGGALILTLMLLPILMGFEEEHRAPAPTRKVVSQIIIEGDIDTVWANVVGFSRITAEPEGVLKYGIAYPIDARIIGEGEGAIRYCNFTTGPFVEPITRWNAPNLLQFDVIRNPMPLNEITMYDEIHAPHLEGFMISERGQFRLEQLEDGRVLLEGTTWYHHDLWPNAYWAWISDYIIHAIHDRVLTHIKTEVEAT